MITTTITISFAFQITPPIIQAVQGDSGRNIVFEISDYTIPTGAEATMYIKKPSGNQIYNSCTISGNTIGAELTAQCLAEHGENFGQVRITKSGEILTSFDFVLLVQRFLGDAAVESTNEATVFDQLVEQAAEYISESLDTTLSIQDKAADAKATGGRLDAIVEPYGTNRKSILQAAILQHEGKTYINQYGGQTSMSAISFDPSKWNEIVLSKILTNVITSIAAPYSTIVTYNTGSWMIRNGTLYRCKEDGVTGEWNSSKWQKKNIGDMIIEFISARVTMTEDNDGFINISIGS